MKYLLHLLVIMATFTSCSYRIADLTMASTRNVDVDGSIEYVELEKYQKGEDKVLSTVLLIGPFAYPDLEEAIDDAVKQVEGGEFMKNITIKKKYRFWLLWSTVSYEVEGDVWGIKPKEDS